MNTSLASFGGTLRRVSQAFPLLLMVLSPVTIGTGLLAPSTAHAGDSDDDNPDDDVGQITGGKTDPRLVYAMRWMATRQEEGVVEFDPPCTLE